jgi:hypothetical protein
MRTLAATIDATPVIVGNLIVWKYPSLQRGMVAFDLVLIAVYVAVEIKLAASPAMLLLGLRVARAGGRAASRRKLAIKAALVRVPTFLHLPAMIATIFRFELPLEGATVGNINAITLASGVLTIAWIAGFLGAFGANRQTLYDRWLKLAVFRAGDVLPE